MHTERLSEQGWASAQLKLFSFTARTGLDDIQKDHYSPACHCSTFDLQTTTKYWKKHSSENTKVSMGGQKDHVKSGVTKDPKAKDFSWHKAQVTPEDPTRMDLSRDEMQEMH